jgi:hypothetical protein
VASIGGDFARLLEILDPADTTAVSAAPKTTQALRCIQQDHRSLGIEFGDTL